MKKIIFSLLLIIFTVSVIEAIAFISYYIAFNEPYSGDKIRTEQQSILSEQTRKTEADAIDTNVRDPFLKTIHPYMGFAKNPELKIPTYKGNGKFKKRDCKYNELGFIGNKNLLKPRKNTVNVIIIGGSVSAQFYCYSRHYLAKHLKQHIPGFQNKQFRFIGLGLGGFKQPQQLMALNLYYTLGGVADIIINIDGHNELVLGKVVSKNSYPAFPWLWAPRLKHYNTPEELNLIALIATRRSQQQRLTEIFQHTDMLATTNTFWAIINDMIHQDILKLNNAVSQMESEKGSDSFVRHGPNIKINNIPKFLSKIWLNASIQMHQIVQANNALYFHFLQPLPHIKGTKPLTRREEKLINSYDHKRFIRKHYPRLVTYAHVYEKNNIPFYDMRDIYQNTKERVYVDSCCHVNKRGSHIMADYIGQKIAEYYSTSDKAN